MKNNDNESDSSEEFYDAEGPRYVKVGIFRFRRLLNLYFDTLPHHMHLHTYFYPNIGVEEDH